MTLFKFKKLTRDAYADWVFILVMFVIASALLVLIGVRAYMNTDVWLNESVANSASSGKSVLNTKKLDKAIMILDQNEAERAELQRGYSGPGDPSL